MHLVIKMLMSMNVLVMTDTLEMDLFAKVSRYLDLSCKIFECESITLKVFGYFTLRLYFQNHENPHIY